MINKQIIKAYALKNAIEHKGKAAQGPVINSLFNHGLEKKEIPKLIPQIQEIISKINNWEMSDQKQEFLKIENLIGHRKERKGLPNLPKGKLGVIMRLAPSASGPLHIGHAITSSLSFLFYEKYGGKLYVRIEDTNPDNSFKPIYNLIKEDYKWLFKGKAEFLIQSNRLEIYYAYAEKLINKKAAYVCTCSSEQFKEFISKKKYCPCRSLSKKQQLEKWNKMLDKSNQGFQPGEAILRFKSGMKLKNPAMRDFPLARINLHPHPLQKNKYKVWPLMNLAVTVDDIEQKMTHIIRGKDHKDNAKRQKMIYKSLGLTRKFPWTAFLGMIHFKDMELSSTKIRQDIESGKYKGYDDPKLPTLASLRKQNYKPEAFYRYAEQRGISEVDKTITKKDFFEVIDNFNKNI